MDPEVTWSSKTAHVFSCSVALCGPIDCSLPSSSVHGIFQARLLKWVAISFSRGIFRTQGWNPCLLHWQVDSLPLRHQGSLFCVFSSVQVSRSVVSDSLRCHESQHTRTLCPSQTSGVHPNSCPLSRCCHRAISSSVVPFCSCPQSLP